MAPIRVLISVLALVTCALFLALPSTGRSSPARMAMIEMTTSSSIKVKPRPAKRKGWIFITRSWMSCFPAEAGDLRNAWSRREFGAASSARIPPRQGEQSGRAVGKPQRPQRAYRVSRRASTGRRQRSAAATTAPSSARAICAQYRDCIGARAWSFAPVADDLQVLPIQILGPQIVCGRVIGGLGGNVTPGVQPADAGGLDRKSVV